MQVSVLEMKADGSSWEDVAISGASVEEIAAAVYENAQAGAESGTRNPMVVAADLQAVKAIKGMTAEVLKDKGYCRWVVRGVEKGAPP